MVAFLLAMYIAMANDIIVPKPIQTIAWLLLALQIILRVLIAIVEK